MAQYTVKKPDNDSHDESDDGALYFEMPYTEDDGFWHDTALQILKRANFEMLNATQQNEFKKFVFALANHVFSFFVHDNTHKIKYEYMHATISCCTETNFTSLLE
jgi:hypothetical protein